MVRLKEVLGSEAGGGLVEVLVGKWEEEPGLGFGKMSVEEITRGLASRGRWRRWGGR